MTSPSDLAHLPDTLVAVMGGCYVSYRKDTSVSNDAGAIWCRYEFMVVGLRMVWEQDPTSEQSTRK
jgi:hypothetical protein